MTGNLSHQIEHHLFPDLPARRYPKIAEEVREICERYGLDYNTGPLTRQLGSVARKILRLALPDRVSDRLPTPPVVTRLLGRSQDASPVAAARDAA
jgi:NADPH-dependent stearoyl-CoA 9-desaturase